MEIFTFYLKADWSQILGKNRVWYQKTKYWKLVKQNVRVGAKIK